MLIPRRMQIPYFFAPISNAVLIGVTCVVYYLTVKNIIPESVTESMVLEEWSFDGLFGSLFLHGDIFHLLGNMFFLWIFGNAINSAMGNVWYVPSYLFLGLCAGATHLVISGGPAVGASGAINGIVGMTLVLFPRNKLDFTFFSFFWGKIDFSVRCYWAILFWLAGDLFGAFSGAGGIGYWAHLGGFFSGMALATIILSYDAIALDDPTLFDLFKDRGKPGAEKVTVNTEDYAFNIQDRVREMERNPAAFDDPFAAEPASFKDDDPFGLADSAQTPQAVEDPASGPPVAVVPPPAPESGTVPPDGSAIPTVSLRVLRSLRENSQWTCFFVNEGDELKNLAVESPDAVKAEVHPDTILRKKEPGWIKMSFQEGSVPAFPEFLLSYRGGNEEIQHIRFTCDESSKTLRAI